MNPTTILKIANEGWPAQVPATARALRIAEGRLSDQPLWRLESGSGEYVLRGWPEGRLRQAQASTRLATHLAGRVGFEVSAPLPTSAGSVLSEAAGMQWELAAWLRGEASYAADPARAKLLAICESLAELHRAAATLAPPPGVDPMQRYLEQLEEVERAVREGRYRAAVCEGMEELACLEPPGLADSLAAGCRVARAQLRGLTGKPLEVQWVWGDAWHSNFLFEGDGVSGVIDFAAARVDTPMADVARLLGSAAGGEPQLRADGLAAYAERRELAAHDRLAVAALEDVATVLSLANWVRWLAIEDRQLPSPAAARERQLHFAKRLAELVGR